MSEQTEHEEALIRAFILPKRQRRYLELLPKPERRPDVTRELAHFKHLDMRFAVPIPPSHGGLDRTLSILKSKGAEDICYVISENDELDGKEMALKEAVCAILGRGIGQFLSCTKGTLGYFEDEDGRWILERKGKS
jgi:hypothetical protein